MAGDGFMDELEDDVDDNDDDDDNIEDEEEIEDDTLAAVLLTPV